MEPARNFYVPDFQAFISYYFHKSPGCMIIIYIHIGSDYNQVYLQLKTVP